MGVQREQDPDDDTVVVIMTTQTEVLPLVH